MVFLSLSYMSQRYMGCKLILDLQIVLDGYIYIWQVSIYSWKLRWLHKDEVVIVISSQLLNGQYRKLHQLKTKKSSLEKRFSHTACKGARNLEKAWILSPKYCNTFKCSPLVELSSI